MIHQSNIVVFAFLSQCSAWSSHYTTSSFRPALRSPKFMSSDQMVPGELDMPGSAELNDSPCWQDIYDDDCSMSNIYAANFIASKWIKSMPCGAGIEVIIQFSLQCIEKSSHVLTIPFFLGLWYARWVACSFRPPRSWDREDWRNGLPWTETRSISGCAHGR